MPSAPGHAAIEEYDRQYQVWVERQGTRALDLDWRLTHLLWRQRALLRRYSPGRQAGARLRLHGRGLHPPAPAARRRGGGLRHLAGRHRPGQAIPRRRRAAGVHHGAAGAGTVRPDLLQRGAGARRGRRRPDRGAGGISGAGRVGGGNDARRDSTSGIRTTSGSTTRRCCGGRWRPGARSGCTATTGARSATSFRFGRTVRRSSSSRLRRRLLRAHADRVGRTVEHVGALASDDQVCTGVVTSAFPRASSRNTLGACTTQVPQPTQRCSSTRTRSRRVGCIPRAIRCELAVELVERLAVAR